MIDTAAECDKIKGAVEYDTIETATNEFDTIEAVTV